MKRLAIFMSAAAMAAFFAAPGWAQKSTKTGALEFTLFGGGTFDLPGGASFAGLTDAGNANNNTLKYMPGKKVLPFVGGGLGIAFAKIFTAYGDYSYVFPDSTTASVAMGGSAGTTSTSRHYWSSNGSLQVSFPTIQRVVPYLEIGMGVLHQNYNTTSSYTNILVTANRTGNTYRTNGVVNDIWTPHVGGGVRIFVKERSGFKFSVDGFYGSVGIEAQVPGTTGTSFPVTSRRGWGRLSAGYFFRFGRH